MFEGQTLHNLSLFCLFCCRSCLFELPVTKGQLFAFKMSDLTSLVSCHVTCHQIVEGFKSVRRYRISTLNKRAHGKGH